MKQLKSAKLTMSKKQYSNFLEQELRKKQDELSALEGMRRNEEGRLSNDEQREREIGESASEQSSFVIGQSSRRTTLRDIHMKTESVERSMFDIRALLSE